MTEIKKIDEITVEVDGKVWTLETLEHSIAQCDIDLEKIAVIKDDYVSIQEKAIALGVIHPKDVVPVVEETVVEEE